MPTRRYRVPRAPTLAKLRQMPPTVDVGVAAACLGMGRATAYAAIDAGEFPARMIRVSRRRLRVVTASLIALLDAPDEAAS